MEELEPSDASPPRDSEIPSAGHDPRDPSRPEVDEEPRTPPIGAPQQDMDAVDDEDGAAGVGDDDDAAGEAQGGDDDDDASDLESELSEIDEAQFEDFDPTAIDIEERPVAVDESNVNLLRAAKRKRAEGEEDAAASSSRRRRRRDKESGSRSDKPKRARRDASDDDDDNFSGGEQLEGKRRRKPKDATDGGATRKEKTRTARKATPENEELLTPEERRKRALDRAMDEALKKPTRRRKVDGIDLEAANDELIERMRIRMTDAAKADTESRQNGQPAMAKLKLLPEVVSLLNRNALREQLVDPDTNLLEAVRFFLEPLNDGSLPAYNIQRELFTALGRLPINKDALVASGIGKVTLFYTKSRKPEQSVKRQADKLLRDWTRPILKRSDDYRKRELAEAVYDPRSLADRSVFNASQGGGVNATSLAAAAARERKLAAPGRANRARVEGGGQTSYTVVPRSAVQLAGGGGQRPGLGGGDIFRRLTAKHGSAR